MKTVDILGFFFPSVNMDVIDKSKNIWTLNDFYLFFKDIKPKRIYQLHCGFQVDTRPNRMVEWKNRYKEYDAEIITGSIYNEFKKEKLFPFQTLYQIFGDAMATSSPAMMMAHAISEGYELINLHGFRMAANGEHEFQLAGIQEMIRIARRKGIKVYADCEKLWDPVPFIKSNYFIPYGGFMINAKIDDAIKEVGGRINLPE